MTLNGWMDYSDRKVVEDRFKSELCVILIAQGWNDTQDLMFSLELSKAVGLLHYYVLRIQDDSRDRIQKANWEGYLVTFLQQMSWEQMA
jgi:hypothetical protein